MTSQFVDEIVLILRFVWSVIDTDIAAMWAQAIGAVGAIITAVALWRADRRRERSQELRQNAEHLRRMVTALRVEVTHAIAAADRQQFSAERVLAGVKEAQRANRPIVGADKLPPGSTMLTEGIIYRAVAHELGKLPRKIIERVVAFYTYTLDIGRLTGIGGAIGAYETMVTLAPRVRMDGLLVIRMLDTYEKSGYDATVDFRVSPDEMRKLATEARYDIDQVMAERGISF